MTAVEVLRHTNTSTSATNLLELKSLTKLYGTVIGVNDITLSVPQGAFGLLGPNGSGKSTLLNLLTGQLLPTIGEIRVLGMVPRNNHELRRRIGYCPGSEGLYANVSARDWVRYLAELHGMSPSEAKKAAERSLDLVGMSASMRRSISTYSRGMRQRTKLAQAIAHDPDVLILDEPFNGLDPVGRHEMTRILLDYIAEGKSLLLASHILHEVQTITDAFLLISGGRLLASGTAEEVNAMMVDVPTQVTIECDDPRRLGRELSSHPDTVGVRYEKANCLTVETGSAGRLLSHLTRLLADMDITVGRVSSTEESLQSLFNSLIRIHRGEQ